MGLGLDNQKVSRKVISTLRKKTWWLPFIIVCSLFLFAQHTNLASPINSDSFFDYVSSPNLRLIEENVTFKCVFSPFVDPNHVIVHLISPNKNTSEFEMIERSKSEFINNTSFSTVGKYSFFISAMIDNQLVQSVSRSFWISYSYSDKDNDKIDDEWERFYGLDTTDPTDAFADFDNDNYKNLDEFTMGTDPLEADYFEFVFFYIESHFQFILLTMFFLLIALFCSIIGLRRSTRWI